MSTVMNPEVTIVLELNILACAAWSICSLGYVPIKNTEETNTRRTMTTATIFVRIPLGVSYCVRLTRLVSRVFLSAAAASDFVFLFVPFEVEREALSKNNIIKAIAENSTRVRAPNCVGASP